MIKSFIKQLKRRRELEDDVEQCIEDDYHSFFSSQQATSTSSSPHKNNNNSRLSTTTTTSPSKKTKLENNVMSKCDEHVIMRISAFHDNVLDCMLVNRHWYEMLKRVSFEEVDDIVIEESQFSVKSERENVVKIEDEQQISAAVNPLKRFSYPQPTRFLKRYSKSESNIESEVIDLTEEPEKESDETDQMEITLNESGILTVDDNDDDNNNVDLDSQVFVSSVDFYDQNFVNSHQSSNHSNRTNVTIDVNSLGSSQRYDAQFQTSFIFEDQSTVLPFGTFSLKLTDPFWTLSVNHENYELDYNKPIFTVANFLKILRYYKSNKWKLTRARITLLQLYHLLKPNSSIFFSSEREVEYFISEIQSIVMPEHVKVGNFTFLVTKYILQYKHWFQDRPEELPNWFKQASLFECSESGAQLNQLLTIRAKNGQNENPLNLEPNQFHVLSNCNHKYEHSELINSCLDGLSITSFEYNDGHFFGDISDRGLPEGFGSWVSADGRYDGYWVNGVKSGEGKYTSSYFVYNGEWMNDEFQGYGELEFTTGEDKGCYYTGSFEGGKKHGQGLQYYCKSKDISIKLQNTSDNDIIMLESQEDDNLLTDEGRSFHAWYRGEWNGDQRVGYGEYRSKTVFKYGMWRRDELWRGNCLMNDPKTDFKCMKTIENFIEVETKSLVPANFLETNRKFFTDDNDENASQSSDSQSQRLDERIIVPKRTLWAGYLFRSRLEARWAIFLEYLSIDYLYECRTFTLANGHKYTPDFYLPMKKIWIEIKPSYPDEHERERSQLLCELPEMKGYRVILLYGPCYPPFIKKFSEGAKGIEFRLDENAIEPVAWTQCTICKRFDLGYRCNPTCHPKANNNSVQPSTHLRMAFEYAAKVQYDEFNRMVALRSTTNNNSSQSTIPL